MSDLPPPAPDLVALAESDPGLAALLAGSPATGVPPRNPAADAAQAIAPPPVEAEPHVGAADALAAAQVAQDGEVAFTTSRPTRRIALVVDGQRYACRTTVAADPCLDLIDAQTRKDWGRLGLVCRELLEAALLPAAWKRYKGRTSGLDLRPRTFDPETGATVGLEAEAVEAEVRARFAGRRPPDPIAGIEFDDMVDAEVAEAVEAIPELEPIGTEQMVEHAVYLVGVYMARPTEGPRSSGTGS